MSIRRQNLNCAMFDSHNVTFKILRQFPELRIHNLLHGDQKMFQFYELYLPNLHHLTVNFIGSNSLLGSYNLSIVEI